MFFMHCFSGTLYALPVGFLRRFMIIMWGFSGALCSSYGVSQALYALQAVSLRSFMLFMWGFSGALWSSCGVSQEVTLFMRGFSGALCSSGDVSQVFHALLAEVLRRFMRVSQVLDHALHAEVLRCFMLFMRGFSGASCSSCGVSQAVYALHAGFPRHFMLFMRGFSDALCSSWGVSPSLLICKGSFGGSCASLQRVVILIEAALAEAGKEK